MPKNGLTWFETRVELNWKLKDKWKTNQVAGVQISASFIRRIHKKRGILNETEWIFSKCFCTEWEKRFAVDRQ